MAPHRTQLLIVGAGPTGLTLACLCRQLGIDLRLIDRASGPSTTSKGIGLQFRASELLAAMGVVDRFLERGCSPATVNIYEGAERLVRLRFDLAAPPSARDAFAPRPIMIPQSETEALLAELLRGRGAEAEWGTELVGFRQEDARVACTLRRADGGEEEIAAEWLVSCEGARSSIRKQAGIAFEGKTYPVSFALADLALDWPLDHAENHVWMHRDGVVAAFPLPTGPRVWRLILDVSHGDGAGTGPVSLDAIQRLVLARTGRDDVRLATPLWASEFRINCRMVDRFREGRVFLAGDAAHIHSPTGGQGITTGMQDAANLAWKLGRVLRGAPESLLDTYQEERLPKAREVLAATDRTTTGLLTPNPLLRWVRDHLLLPMMRQGAVQKRMFGKFAQLHVSYRGSRLSRDDAGGWRRPLRAGDRAPDVAFGAGPSGERVTLFGLLRDARPVVLVGRRPGAAGAAGIDPLVEALAGLDLRAHVVVPPGEARGRSHPGWLTDVHGDFRRFYGLDGDFLCLVRPDGHLGLVQRPIRTAPLMDYLRQLCPAAAVARAAAGLPG